MSLLLPPISGEGGEGRGGGEKPPTEKEEEKRSPERIVYVNSIQDQSNEYSKNDYESRWPKVSDIRKQKQEV